MPFNIILFFRSPLHYAAGHGHYDSICSLIDAGVTIDAIDHLGCSALHYAAFADSSARYVL